MEALYYLFIYTLILSPSFIETLILSYTLQCNANIFHDVLFYVRHIRYTYYTISQLSMELIKLKIMWVVA